MRAVQTLVRKEVADGYTVRHNSSRSRTHHFHIHAAVTKRFDATTDHPPLKITLDGHWHSHRALRLLRREHAAWRRVRVRSSKYLNNIVEQDHRAIKQRCGPMRGFKSFANAAVTIAGIELAHRIHKH